ncbi:MAG: metallophosphoesterase [bacterium]|nr:metallophosphoesterase [bacterium]
MVLILFAIPCYCFVFYFLYGRITGGFQPTKHRKRLIAAAGLGITLYYVLGIVIDLYVFDFYAVVYLGGVWLRVVLMAFFIFSLETGLSLLFPRLRRLWTFSALSIALLYTAFDIHRYPGVTNIRANTLPAILFTIIFLLNYVIYKRVSGLGLAKRGQGGVIVFLWVMMAFCFISFYGIGGFIRLSALLWFGCLSIGATLLAPETIISFFFPKWRKQIMAVTLVLIIFSIIFALYAGTGQPVVRETAIPLKNISEKQKGFSILQLSDLHIEGKRSLDYFRGVVDKANTLAPDLIVITGDIFDSGIEDREEVCETLRRLKAPAGVVAVLGNHEYYTGLEFSQKLLTDAGITVLRNSSLQVGGIGIVGIDDPSGQRFNNSGPDLKEAMKGVDKKSPVVLLSHRPFYFDEARSMGVDLQLSGHTHAGQILPIVLFVRMYYRYPYGLYEKEGAYIYTSCGTRLWGPPMRMFSRNEMVMFTLVGR